MRYSALRECLSSHGLEEVGEGIWLYWDQSGPYLFTCKPEHGELEGTDVVRSLWIQLPPNDVRDKLGECIERLFDAD